jgi:hypothetical protein
MKAFSAKAAPQVTRNNVESILAEREKVFPKTFENERPGKNTVLA